MTNELKLILGGKGPLSSQDKSGFSPLAREHVMFRDLDSWKWQSKRESHAWSTVNVTQPLKDFTKIPDDIPIIIGANKHEGEMFVHGAFPLTMSKAVYWMFVGALFRDSASKVLKHYREHVDEIEREGRELARRQIEEEENRQFYFEHRGELDHEYQMLLEMNSSSAKTDIQSLLHAWNTNRGGASDEDMAEGTADRQSRLAETGIMERISWFDRLLWFRQNLTDEELAVKEMQRQQLLEEKRLLREQKRKERAKARALKKAARVVVDYRPVMSRIIDDYLFRCPAWYLANSISRQRVERSKTNNVFVYQFSHNTHIPGYAECWGKSCHTSEIPYVFEAMDIIRSNYSTLGPYAQDEAPSAPEYPYTEMLAAYRGAMEAADRQEEPQSVPLVNQTEVSKRFQRLVHHFFGDYFRENADEEIASDMADRWVAFARTGDPNYDGSRAEWKPWRHIMDPSFSREDTYQTWTPKDFDRIFNLDTPQDVDMCGKDEYLWSEDPQEQIYRRRALSAMGMEIIEEDVFRTMLRRKKEKVEEAETLFDSFPFGSSVRHREAASRAEQARRAAIQLQQIAQDMGVIGTGLLGEPRKGGSLSGTMDFWEENFFPEILDLKWPPEGRLGTKSHPSQGNIGTCLQFQ